MFQAMSAGKMASLIASATQRVAVVAPGLRETVVQALLDANARLGSQSVAVVLDCDEEVFRLGYGDLVSIQRLRQSGVDVRQGSGLRIGVLVCDSRAWVYAPTALYVQGEVHSDETPNAVELISTDVERLVWRVMPMAGTKADCPPLSPQYEAERREAQVEVGLAEVSTNALSQTAKALEVAPPVAFDVARQVRVFEPYIQYVEVSLAGCAIQRRRIEIPKVIQGIGTSPDLEQRLRTTFELIERGSNVSSKALEDELRLIREHFTRPLGKPWGRVVLRSARVTLDERLIAFRAKLAEHKDRVKADLGNRLEDSKKAVVDYYLPLVKESPPDALRGQLLSPSPDEDTIRRWLTLELERVFPKPEELITEMTLDVQFRDVTFETLNEDGFGAALRKAYPHVNWNKPFDAFNAAKARA